MLGLLATPVQPLLAQRADQVLKIAELGGAMHAAAKVCQDYSDEELRNLKQAQKSQATAAGVSSAQFEAVFQAGYDQARARLAAATPAKREESCQQLRAVVGMMKAR